MRRARGDDLRPRHRRRREADLARLLRATLRSYAETAELHPCPSCATDLSILRRKATALGVVIDR